MQDVVKVNLWLRIQAARCTLCLPCWPIAICFWADCCIQIPNHSEDVLFFRKFWIASSNWSTSSSLWIVVGACTWMIVRLWDLAATWTEISLLEMRGRKLRSGPISCLWIQLHACTWSPYCWETVCGHQASISEPGSVNQWTYTSPTMSQPYLGDCRLFGCAWLSGSNRLLGRNDSQWHIFHNSTHPSPNQCLHWGRLYNQMPVCSGAWSNLFACTWKVLS